MIRGCFVQQDFLLDILRFRNIFAVDAQEFLFQGEDPFTQVARFKIDQPLRVESVSLVPRFEMQMRTGRAAGGAAQANDLSGPYPVSRLYVPAGKMAVEGLQAVFVPDNNQVAIAPMVLG